MKGMITGLVLIVVLGSFIGIARKETPVTKNNSYKPGEEIEYRVNFSLFTVGKAITRIDKSYHQVNSRTCYKVDAYGETSSWISWVAKVDDNWGAYIDTALLTTQVAYRKLKEGSYRKDEIVEFNHENRKVNVKVLNKETKVYDSKEYDIPLNAKDLVGGFLMLRVIDFAKVAKGDTITISGFFEDKSYNLNIIYTGKEIISTRVGKIQCLRLRPLMPNNAMFDGEDSILCWISDDLNKIPIKIQAKMFIGHTGLEMIGFRGLRNQLRIVQ